MKVSELVSKLQGLDENDRVIICDPNDGATATITGVESDGTDEVLITVGEWNND